MAYEDINDRYNKSFNSTKSLLESQNKSKLNDLQNQEADMNNKYAQLLDTYNANKTDNQKRYYEQRNSADVTNAKDTRRMNELALAKGWRGGTLAQINLDQNSQRSNALGAINSQENKFLSDLAMQQLNAKRDNTTALSQLANNRNLANEQYRTGLYAAQQDSESKRLADIYAAQQSEKQQQWEAEQSALQRAFQDQQQQAQFASQKELANMENVYKNSQQTKSDENDQLKQLNNYWDDVTKNFDSIASMRMKEYKDGDGNIVNKDIDVEAKKMIYNAIKNDSTLIQEQKNQLMERYNLNKDMYLLEPQPQQQQLPQLNQPVNDLWNQIIGKTKAWWQR